MAGQPSNHCPLTALVLRASRAAVDYGIHDRAKQELFEHIVGTDHKNRMADRLAAFKDLKLVLDELDEDIQAALMYENRGQESGLLRRDGSFNDDSGIS